MTMQPIEKQVHDAFEIVSLMNLFEEEIRCESNHKATGKASCTVEVTHITSTCRHSPKRVCRVTGGYYERAIRAEGSCGDCGVPIEDCWKVRPI